MKTWTVLELLNWAEDYFTKHNIPEPKTSAEWLLSTVLNFDNRLELYTKFEAPVSETNLQTFKKYIIRRLNREPVQYICGKTSFFGFPITVNRNVLIPRPETELLVEKAKEIIAHAPVKILDLCTGSAAIAVALAKLLGNKKIFAADISYPALQTAKQNIAANGTQIHLINGDMLQPFKDNSFDVIISNPPYIKTADMANLEPEIKDNEPLAALDGGEEGLDAYKKIIPAAERVLKNNGLLILEIGPVAAQNIQTNLTKIDLVEDLNHLPRILILKKS